MENLKEVILQYVINEYLEDDSVEVTFETPLLTKGIVDSFSMVSLKRFLESKYEIQIPDDRATPEAFDSVSKIAELVDEFID
ncbi:MAG: acyl carrier protein [Bacteroidetes bacterium]|nr:acyl carrier protein [Bacteroidota bacterium]MBL6964734.1 acyl carrier protein [Bacteroidota bacterium]